MKREPLFLSEEQVRKIHQAVIEAFGGDGAVRDRRLLASAIAMPAATFEGRFLHASVSAMAAAYLFHLCKNHPVDGNKRTALAAAEVFLVTNGWSLTATDQELGDLTVGVAEGAVSKEEVIIFLKHHCNRG